MRAGARLVVAAIAVSSTGAALLDACSSSDDGAQSDGGGYVPNETYDASFDACAAFSGNGSACTVPSTLVCPPCDCVCAQGPTGLKWACIVDGANCGPPVATGDDGAASDGPATDGRVGDANVGDSNGTDANGGPDTSGGPDANDGATSPDADDGATE